jgi:hypothetical protein
VLADTQLVIFGGHYYGTGSFVYLNDVHVLDVETSTWHDVRCAGEPMGVIRAGASFAGGTPRRTTSGEWKEGSETGFGKGPDKKKSATPVVGGWVKGQKRIRIRFIFYILYGVL